MKVDYVTVHNPDDVRSWSGLNLYIMKCLEGAGFKINKIFGHSARPNLYLKLHYKWWLFWKKNYQYERTDCYGRQFAAFTEERLDPDASFVLTNNTALIPYLKTKKPIILYSDATFYNLAEYYDYLSGLPAGNRGIAERLEQKAVDRCTMLFYASEWAAATAVNHYHQPASKVHVLPFGANLTHPPAGEFIRELIASKSMEEIVFLFVGVEFERKGGPMAIEIVRQLNNKGIRSSLIMAGMTDLAQRNLPAFVTDAGFLNKNNPVESTELNDLFKKAHFFLMPVQRECYGVVFVEANSYGLPCFTNNISGIPTIITNGINGHTFNLDAPAEAYVLSIQSIVETPGAYQQLATSSRREYDTRLNWQKTGEKIMQLTKHFVTPQQ